MALYGHVRGVRGDWLSGERLGFMWIGRGARGHRLYAFHVPGFMPGTLNVISFNPHKNLVKYCSSHLQMRSQKLGDLELPAQHHTVNKHKSSNLRGPYPWVARLRVLGLVPACHVPGSKAAIGASSWERCHFSSVKRGTFLEHRLHLWLSHVFL